jgi:hypothetical protein
VAPNSVGGAIVAIVRGLAERFRPAAPLILIACVGLWSCAGTPLKRAADAGSVTVAATSEARKALVAWAVGREQAINGECEAACSSSGPMFATCFSDCRMVAHVPVDRAVVALRAYRMALQAEAGIEEAAAAIVNVAREVVR